MVKYFTTLEHSFWQTENQRLPTNVYDNCRIMKQEMIDSFREPINVVVSDHDKTRDVIAKKENGTTEKECIVGRIDVETKTEVIEVKAEKDWKAGLGQALAYSFVTRKRPRLHLYDNEPSYLCKKVCLNHGVALTYGNGW